jgi:hypothetical protein
MDWRYDSSSKAPALQVRSPEFKSESHKKKEKNHMIISTYAEKAFDKIQCLLMILKKYKKRLLQLDEEHLQKTYT